MNSFLRMTTTSVELDDDYNIFNCRRMISEAEVVEALVLLSQKCQKKDVTDSWSDFHPSDGEEEIYFHQRIRKKHKRTRNACYYHKYDQ